MHGLKAAVYMYVKPLHFIDKHFKGTDFVKIKKQKEKKKKHV